MKRQLPILMALALLSGCRAVDGAPGIADPLASISGGEVLPWAATATPTRTPTPTHTPVPALQPGATMVSPKDGMVMVYVPAGSFLMGSRDDPQVDDDEFPQHTPHLDAYWIDQTEVTNGMYSLCVKAGVCESPHELRTRSRSSYYGNPAYAGYPVIDVDLYQALEYCEWAGRRLPTEAEWEKAARGEDARIYPWGSQAPTCELANSTGCEGDTWEAGSHPAGASPYGVLDMAGNVWEWVSSEYRDYPYAAHDGRENPNSSEGRVVRGGSWDFDPRRTAYRSGENPTYWFDDLGFRCARPPAVVPPRTELPTASPTELPTATDPAPPTPWWLPTPVPLTQSASTTSLPTGVPTIDIAYVGTVNLRPQVLIMEAGAYQPRQIFAREGYITYSPAWSPAGDKLAFLVGPDLCEECFGEDFPTQIFVVESDGTGLVVLTPDDGAVISQITWSPGGTKIAYTRETSSETQPESLAVWIADVASRRSRVVAELPGGFGCWQPAWSPDGMYLLVKCRSLNQSWPVIVFPDGSEFASDLAGYPNDVEWFQSGEKIAAIGGNCLLEVISAEHFLSRGVSGKGEEWMCIHDWTLQRWGARLDGSRKIFLSPFEDASMIVVTDDALNLIDLEAESARVLGRVRSELAYKVRQLTWSSNGTSVGATLFDGHDLEIVVIDLLTGGITKITDNDTDDFMPSFRP